jgi:hypothetical protein
MAKKGATRSGKGVVRKKGKKKKFAGRNNGPARGRYWSERRLMEHKIANLMRCCGMTRAEAVVAWTRTARMK